MRRLALIPLLLLSWAASPVRAGEPATSGIPQGARQLVLVTTATWTDSSATLRRFARPDAATKWKEVGTPRPAQVGEHGLAWGLGLKPIPKGTTRRKQEGDRRAPAGVFAISGAFGAEARSDLRLPYRRLTAATEAVDDPASRFYNQIVERNAVGTPDWKSSERMAAVRAYALGIAIESNPRHVPGAGSCIFIHAWLGERQGTAGCTILHPADLAELARWLDATQRPVLMQLPVSELTRVDGNESEALEAVK